MEKGKDFIEKVENYMLEEKLLRARDKILVGFSGGADSTALLLVLYHLRSKYNLHILATSINYHLRGAENVREEKFVTEFCFARNIAVLVNHFEPAGKKINENTLREYRLNWFKKLVKSYKFTVIALGHNKSDQSETMICRLLRGSLLTGLGGIRPRTGLIIHPLLPFSREEITGYLKSEGISWCKDSSNEGLKFTRNKIRNELFPWVEANINPRASEKIAESASFLQEADNILRKSALNRLRHAISENNDDEIVINIADLMRTSFLLRFYVYRHLYHQVTGSYKDFYQSNYEEIEQALSKPGNRLVQLPHQVFFNKEYDNLIVYKNGLPQEPELEAEKEIPSLRNRFAYDGWRISMKKLKKLPEKRSVFLDRNIAYMDFDKLKWPLVVRHRQAGDKFIPYGMTSSKKLKDFFIDIKLPVTERSRTLVFADQDKILWIGGHRLDSRVSLSDETVNILMLKIEKIQRRKSRPAERMKK